VGPEDWDGIAAIPLYGMPHVTSDRIVVGQQPAPFWDAVTAVLSRRVSGLREVYGDPIDLGGFADLLVSHELTHLSHGESWPPGPVGFWLRELTANVGLQGYVAVNEPSSLPVLETVFEATWAGGPDAWPVRDLVRMEQGLEGDGSNYVWFEFGLQVLAKRLWQSSGAPALQTLVTALRGPELTFDEVVSLLEKLDPTVAQAIRSWPDFR